jgi:hypothetical protein
MPIRERLLDTLFSREVDRRVREAVRLATAESPWRSPGDPLQPGRPWHTVRGQLEKLATVCRANPLAARLVSMTTDFVIGSGATLGGDPLPPFVHAYWHHPLNRLDGRVYRWCDELTRSGELFLVLSRNRADGMSYVREVPALLIDRIETDADDIEREVRYHQLTADVEGRWWPGRDSAAASAESADSNESDQIMLHYAVNRPVGEVRGMSDLAQILPWLERYDIWLEDRVRINRYKGAYLWQVRVENALPGQLEAKRAQYARVPAPGSIIVTDGHETWSAVQPQINADDVEADGRAIRLMIAAGAGVPLHFLAESESATRATAREMGTATYRHFAHRQHVFSRMVEDIIAIAAQRAGQPPPGVTVSFQSVLAEGDGQTTRSSSEGGAHE